MKESDRRAGSREQTRNNVVDRASSSSRSPPKGRRLETFASWRKRRRKDREKKKGKKEEREKGKKSDIACGNSDIGLDLGSSSDLCDIFTIRREFLSLRIGKIIGTIPVRNATPPSRRRINPFVYRDTIYQKLRYPSIVQHSKNVASIVENSGWV